MCSERSRAEACSVCSANLRGSRSSPLARALRRLEKRAVASRTAVPMFFSEQISGRAAKSLSLASHDEKKRTARGSERCPRQTSSENLHDNGFKFKARHERQQ